MKKTIISVIGIALMLFAVTACRPSYIFVPFHPDNSSSVDEPVWDGTTVDTSWYSKSAASFSLSTPAELAGLAKLAEENDFAGKTITLTEDINLGGHEWAPIGTATKPFKGTIEGNGVKISNLKMTEEIISSNPDDQKVAGFIGFLAGGGVKGITFTDASISVGQDVAAAVVAGFMNGGSISNVKVDNADINGGYKSDMGTIAGKLYDEGSVTNCEVTGISIILDAEQESYESCNVGGIVGSLSHEGSNSASKTISGNTVNLSGDSNDMINVINATSWGDIIPVGGIIGQIGGETEGTVSGNTLIIADVNQIANGMGGIITGYSQEFSNYSNNTGKCRNKEWHTGDTAENDGNARVSKLN